MRDTASFLGDLGMKHRLPVSNASHIIPVLVQFDYFDGSDSFIGAVPKNL